MAYSHLAPPIYAKVIGTGLVFERGTIEDKQLAQILFTYIILNTLTKKLPVYFYGKKLPFNWESKPTKKIING